MRAFLSHQFKDNISEINNLLIKLGVEVFDAMVDIEYGSSFQRAIKKAIKECDFVVVIYTSENPNIAFEAGIAVSSNKPIFSIISETNNDPDFLFDTAYVHAKPNEIDKIEFNFKIFLEKLKPKKKTTKIKSHKEYGGGSTNYYNKILFQYNNINKKSEKNFELLFKEIFELYQLNVIKNKFDNNQQFYTDFSIWSDKLSNVIGNPILIEIKKEINKNNIKTIQKTVDNLIKNNSSESCLIFYDSLKGIEKKELPNTSKYIFIQIIEFIEKLNKYDFNNSIRVIRNEIVHNQF